MRRSAARRGLAVLALCLAALLAPGPAAVAMTSAAGAGAAAAGPAQTAYRYWSFWIWDEEQGDWEYSGLGPGSLRPHDGDLLGFRFSVSAEAGDSVPPRGSASFAEICGTGEGAGDAAPDEGERVAFVLDFGTAQDAPAGQTPPAERTACAPLDGGATAAEALAEVAAPLRYDSHALLCAIAGYPAEGCGEPVSAREGESGAAGEAGSEAAGPGGENGGASPAGIAAGLAAVLLLGGAAVVRARRRRG